MEASIIRLFCGMRADWGGRDKVERGKRYTRKRKEDWMRWEFMNVKGKEGGEENY